MYRDLDHLLSAPASIDSWYDDGCIIASEIVTHFQEEDWMEISAVVHVKPTEWQKKLAYCLDSSCHIHELKILLTLINTTDDELFEIYVDTLRSYTDLASKKLIINDPSIVERVKRILPNASKPVKRVLENFLIHNTY